MQKIIQNWEKVILIISEILWNYYGIESQERMETLRTIFRISYDCLNFYCLSLGVFLWYFKTKLIIYGLLGFAAWLVYAK